MSSRYDTSGNLEDEYYPGTTVLVNAEGISDPEELLGRETELFVAAYQEIFAAFDRSLTPDLRLFYSLHHKAFARLFTWAGRPRTVGISKGGTPFCPPQNIAAVLQKLFTGLAAERWLAGLERGSFLGRAAYYVCELNAVHPFRDGNGRTIRFLMDVLAARAHGELFDWTQTNEQEYLQVCVAGFAGEYELTRIVLERCLPAAAGEDKSGQSLPLA